MITVTNFTPAAEQPEDQIAGYTDGTADLTVEGLTRPVRALRVGRAGGPHEVRAYGVTYHGQPLCVVMADGAPGPGFMVDGRPVSVDPTLVAFES